MTAERLEAKIVSGTGKELGHLILTPINEKITNVEGDFLSNGNWYVPLTKVKRMLELQVKAKCHHGYRIIYHLITNHTQYDSETKVSGFIHQG